MGRKLSRSSIAKKAWETRRKNEDKILNMNTEVAQKYESTSVALEYAIDNLIRRINEQTQRIKDMM